MTKLGKSVIVVAITCTLIVGLSCCRKEGPAERAGQQIDTAVEKAGHQVEKAGEKIEDVAKDTNRK